MGAPGPLTYTNKKALGAFISWYRYWVCVFAGNPKGDPGGVLLGRNKWP